MNETTRPNTPPTDLPGGGQRITVKRCCNGCNRELGDATPAELDAAVAGRPLPDVTNECGCPPTPVAPDPVSAANARQSAFYATHDRTEQPQQETTALAEETATADLIAQAEDLRGMTDGAIAVLVGDLRMALIDALEVVTTPTEADDAEVLHERIMEAILLDSNSADRVEWLLESPLNPQTHKASRLADAIMPFFRTPQPEQVTTEFGIRWDDGQEVPWAHREAAEGELRYVADYISGVLIERTVSRGPWRTAAVTPEGEKR